MVKLKDDAVEAGEGSEEEGRKERGDGQGRNKERGEAVRKEDRVRSRGRLDSLKGVSSSVRSVERKACGTNEGRGRGGRR